MLIGNRIPSQSWLCPDSTIKIILLFSLQLSVLQNIPQLNTRKYIIRLLSQSNGKKSFISSIYRYDCQIKLKIK